jgi:hypothetical protein
MRERVRFSKASGLAGAVAAVWLLLAGPVWAGGASDAGALQTMLCNFATSDLGIPCPQYPTYTTGAAPNTTPLSPATPIVLENAAWQNVTPDSLRMTDSDCTQFGTNVGGLYCPQIAVNATNPLAKSPLSDVEGGSDAEDGQPPVGLSSLSSLAFVSKPAGTPPLTVTQNLDPTATSKVYAVVDGANLDLYIQNLTGTNTKHSKGQVVATVPFWLAVLANGAATEKSVVAILQITATCNGAAACLTANVWVDFAGTGTKKMYSPAALGLNFEYLSGTYLVQFPLLVNPKTDQFYFPISGFASLPQCPNGSNPISGYCNAFSATKPPNGFAPKFLTNTVVGMAPSAAPQCPGAQPGTTCPTNLPSNPTQPLTPTFGFCAYLSNNAVVSNTPDAAFYLAIGPDGTTYTSSPVAPALSGAPYPACPS